MGSFDITTKTVILPDEFIGKFESNPIHFFPTTMVDYFGVSLHHLGISARSENTYKAKKQAELKQFGCKKADIEFAFYFKNIPIIKLINKEI